MVDGANSQQPRRLSMFACLRVPTQRLGAVLLRSAAIQAEPAEFVFRGRPPLLRCPLVPAKGLGVVLGNAATIFVHCTDVELGGREAFVRCPSVKAKGFLVVERHTLARGVRVRQMVHRLWYVFVGGLSKPSRCLGEIR